MGRDELLDVLRENRGIETPCTVCDGWGVRAYGSTATWRGGVGGQQITSGVCDSCWGSGDAYKPWVNWKRWEDEKRRFVAWKCMQWLEHRLGRDGLRESLEALREHLLKEGFRRRRAPCEHVEAARVMASVIGEMLFSSGGE